ncbi:MAG: hypothetical protein ACXVPP_06660 [Actinomycetota bacterium]
MLRQLARLTRRLPAAGPTAVAVAVYADGNDEVVAARESGFEGVACIDDAARLLGVLCRVWSRDPLQAIEVWARGLLEFVLWMQASDGRWLNFVYDWNGRRNYQGVTSAVGENFWHGRALSSLSRAWLTFGDARAEAEINRGLEYIVSTEAPSDVRALHLDVGLRLIVEAGRTDLESAVRRWAHEIAACREGDVLMNNSDERGTPHLWAHVQEGVLADAGAILEEPSLIDAARRSAKALLEPAVGAGFDRVSTTPYDVASTAFSLDRLAAVTGEPGWARLAADARAWFDGRNPAGSPVYDRRSGRVADGVDEGLVSRNSGAEANVEAAGALLDDAVASAALVKDLMPQA